MHEIAQRGLKRGLTWLGRLRLRLIVFVIGIPLAAFGIITIGPAWLTLPVVGVALAAVTMTVNKTAGRIIGERCWTCGENIKGEPAGEQGVVCPECGALNQFNPMHLAIGDEPVNGYDFSHDDDDDESDDDESA